MAFHVNMSKIIATHSGRFHTDDVCAVATLILSFPPNEEVSIVRTRDMEKIKTADYVVDVGGIHDPASKRFDHHQIGGAGIHEGGIPYASFGLVWKEYGEQISGSTEVAKAIEEKMVLPIDAIDNGVEISKSIMEGVRPYTLSDYLYSFWADEKTTDDDWDKIFLQVVGFAKNLITREIQKTRHILSDEKLVEDIYSETDDKRLIIFDKHLAFGNVLSSKKEPLFVVYPDIGGTAWNAKAVRADVSAFETRKPFPESWAGKTGQAMAEASGVEDATFCHTARFIAVAKSKDGAIALANIAIAA